MSLLVEKDRSSINLKEYVSAASQFFNSAHNAQTDGMYTYYGYRYCEHGM